MNKMKKIAIILMLLLTLSGCRHEQADTIYIVYTNDVAGELKGNIGYAGVKYFKDQVLAEHQYVTLVDAGDFYDGKIAGSGGSVSGRKGNDHRPGATKTHQDHQQRRSSAPF